MSSMRTPNSPGEVDAGLDREAHPGDERLLLALDHVRRLVGGDADAVAGAVDELLAVPRVGDHRASGPVDLLAGHAGPDRLDAGLLRLPHDLVDLADLCGAAHRRTPCGWCPSRSRTSGRRSRARSQSPSSITRSPASWCGLAPFGPEPTTVKSTCSCPNSPQQPGEVGGHVGLAAGRRSAPSTISPYVASAAAPAAVSRASSLCVLDRPQHRQALRHRAVRRVRERRPAARAGASPRRSRRSP